MIDMYFEEYKIFNDVDYERIYEENKDFEFTNFNDKKKSFITDENRLIVFSHLKKFIEANKSDFISINISKKIPN
jgi:site-specific DNA-adenine methylase